MSSASRPPHALSAFRRGCLVAAAVAVGALAGSVGLPLRASAIVPATAPAAGSALSLAGQTSWVRGRSGLRLQLRIRSSLPVSRLGLKFVLYSRLTSRSAFEQSLGGVEAASELPVDTPGMIPLGLLDHRGSADGAVTIRFPVETAPTTPSRSLASPRLDLVCGNQCDGVYPLEAVLVDSADDTPLAALTTHLVYIAGTAGTLPLRVSIVLPMGNIPALGTAGEPVLGSSRLEALQSLLTTIARYPNVPITLELYPQLLVALERDRAKQAQSVLALLDSILEAHGTTPAPPGRQVLGASFAPVEVTALTEADLDGELARQLARGRQALDSGLGQSVRVTPFVSYGPLGRRSLLLLEHDGVRQLVVPATDVTTTGGTPVPTVALTSPFELLPPESAATGTGSTTPGPVALAADPGLAAHFGTATHDPVLAAHQLLADLAEIYFDAPSDPDTRGVVVAPASWEPNAHFLSTVLSAFSGTSVLLARTLGGTFSQVPVGGNGSPKVEQLASGPASPRRGLAAAPVVKARRALGILGSILPDDKALLARLGDAILISQSTGLGSSARRAYAQAPRGALALLGKALSISGGRTITLTSRTGEIPITIVSSSPYPIHALIELRDSALDFLGDSARPEPVTFRLKTTAREFRVTTRTSGASRLDVLVVSPTGHVTLLSGAFSIRSTAVSSVAIALSIGALLVLAAWWLRSVLRHRRRAAAIRRASAGGDTPALE